MLDDRSWRYSIFKWLFQTTIDFTEDPPTKPPEIKFKTKVYHLNIRCDGNVCLKSNNEFTEGEKFIKVFYEIYYLFIKQNPANTWPAFKKRKELYESNREEFNRIASEWTKKYATAELSNDIYNSKK